MIKEIITLLTTAAMALYPTNIAAADEFETRYVSASALNCRTEPNINSDIITVFENGKELRVIGADGEWWEVYDGKTQGWCFSAYLKSTKEETTYTSDNSNGTYLGNFKVSYYTCSPSENGGSNLTAMGQKLTDVVGIAIAADPNVIPYNSKVYIEGVGVRTVLDCGGAIKGNKIDVLVRNNGDIPSCGIHYSDVYLID